MKICCKCKEEKAESEFYKRRGRKNNLSSRCKSCSNEYFREYREKNREKVRSYDHVYYKNNRKEISVRRSKRYMLKTLQAKQVPSVST